MNDNLKKIELHDIMRNEYMEYAMSTIIDRALPDVRDGVMPIHRRILYAMYNAKIFHNKQRSKSTEPVSETMKIHYHGDSSIYQSLSLLTEQNETLLHPFIDGEGSFGKAYSKDSPSHMRYTFCRLNEFSEEMFIDFNKEVIKMVGEDDNHLQPIVLNCSYPSILVKPNEAIAVGESCKWGSFPLSEVCDTTIKYIDDKTIDIIDYLKPDFSTGGCLLYDEDALKKIYDTGKGSITLKSKYRYDKENNLIEIYEIPYSTTVNKIVVEVKSYIGHIKDIIDVRDETGFNDEIKKEQLLIVIDVKKNTNVKKIMNILFKKTTLQDTFSYNMNCLVNYAPKVLGIKQVLDYWLEFRSETINKAIQYSISDKEEKLHTLLGLKKVLLDIDYAIKIIRESKECDIINSLCDKFKIDTKQADFISNIKLRKINESHIIKKIKEIDSLQKEIEDLKYKLNNQEETNAIIKYDLERIKQKYGKPRITEIIHEDEVESFSKEDLIEDNSVAIVLTKEGYVKKTLKYATDSSHTIKDGDTILQNFNTTNKSDLLLFTDTGNILIIKAYDLDYKKPSSLGQYIENIADKKFYKKGEKILHVLATKDWSENLIVVFENGKLFKCNLSKLKPKNNRGGLINIINQNSPTVGLTTSKEEMNILLVNASGHGLIFNTSNFELKGKKASGVKAMKMHDKFIDDKVLLSVFDPTDEILTLTTNKNKMVTMDLQSEYKEEKWFDYLYKAKGAVKGNFIYNTNIKKDEIISVESIKPIDKTE